MADDDDDETPEIPDGIPMNFVWHGGGEALPPQIQKMFDAIQEQQERQQMAAADRYHNEMRFYEEASLDHLRAHLTTLSACDNGENPALAFHVGYVQAVIKMRFNVCPAHGVNHDEEMLAELTKDAGGEPPQEGE